MLTRLPPPARRTVQVVAKLIAANFPASRFLSPRGAETLLARLPELRLVGGTVYRPLGVDVEVLPHG